MKIMPVTIACLTVALLAAGGSALYYRNLASNYETSLDDAMAKLAEAIRTPAPSKAASVAEPVLSSSADSADINALLEQLAATEQELETLRTASNREARQTPRERRAPIDWEARMEDMKQNDPERYAEMIARRDEMRNRMQSAFAERAATLLNHTPINLTESEAADRELMFQTLENTWALSEKLADENLTMEERGEIFRTLRENGEVLQPLLEDERTRQLHDLGLTSGYSEEEADQFVDYINDTLEATSMGFRGFAGGGRGRGR